VVSAGIGAAEVMGHELHVGAIQQSMIEYEKGVIVAVLLGNSATLAIVADLKANLGNVRYQAKKRGPALAALL
jgi:predicted regulator of Ras-like GTPase activity (Roadblock/LC7/MglB family)